MTEACTLVGLGFGCTTQCIAASAGLNGWLVAVGLYSTVGS